MELSYYGDAVPPGTRTVFWAAGFSSKSLRAEGEGRSLLQSLPLILSPFILHQLNLFS